MKGLKQFFLMVFLGVVSPVFAQNIKVIGYLPSHRFHLYDKIDFCSLTHLDISFANPIDNEGNLAFDADPSRVITEAKKANPEIKVYAALAGGGGKSDALIDRWSYLIDDNAQRRNDFIQKIVAFVKTNHYDGIDIDIENSLITRGYSPFVIGLAAALHGEGKDISGALPWWVDGDITQAALDAYDYINIMSYDHIKWDGSRSDPHSTFEHAVSDLDFWNKTRGISTDRLSLGLPFYGWYFNPKPESYTYKIAVDADVSNADDDTYNGGWHNGRPLIKRKVNLALDRGADIMIWELGQDDFGAYSLLSTIWEVLDERGVSTGHFCKGPTSVNEVGDLKLKVFPNPAEGSRLTVTGKQIDLMEVAMVNGFGQTLPVKIVSSSIGKLELDIVWLAKGVYFITLKSQQSVFSHKVIIK